MPFSFSNFSSTAILLMVACLSIVQLVKHLRKRFQH